MNYNKFFQEILLIYAFSVFILVYPTVSTEEDCGIRNENSDLRTLVPWTVAIFLRRNPEKPFKYFIAGTILNSRTILSLYGGRFGNPTRGSKYFIPSPQNIKIVAGFETTLQDPDQFAQSSQVSYIVPFMKHSTDNKVYHYYLIHLKESLDLSTPYVRAICLPAKLKQSHSEDDVDHHHLIWFHQNEYKNSRVKPNVYFLGGFSPLNNLKSVYLNIKQINLTSEEQCALEFHRNYHQVSTKHVLCGYEHYHSPVQDESCILHGAALFYQMDGKWFLHGVNGLIPTLKTSNKCTQESLYIFGNFHDSFDWILDNIKCGPQNFVCTNSRSCIPHKNVCNSIEDCLDGEDEKSLFCQATNHCKSFGNKQESFHSCGLVDKCISFDQLCDGIPQCDNGSDEAAEICKNSFPNQTKVNNLPMNGKEEIKVEQAEMSPLESNFCIPIQLTEGVIATCKNPDTNQNVPCGQAVRGQTMVTLDCDEQYRSTLRLQQVRMRCGLDGTWLPNRHFSCEVDCGIISSGFSLHLTFGKIVNQNNAFPWYASIYRKKMGKFEFICGGNLIENNVILTAAHCITNQNGKLQPSQQFTVILAPISNNFNDNQADRFSQIIQVESMYIPSSFNYDLLQSDIAILKLAKAVELNDFVRPVCYLPPFYSDFPIPGTVGKVAGLGYDETKKVSKVVKYLNFPTVSHDECRRALRRIPPLKTFCGGYRNGSAVCKGDSGSGLAFPEHNGIVDRYVLKGIVSHGEITDGRLCDQENYAVFTHVDSFKPFILSVLEAIENNFTILDDDWTKSGEWRMTS